MQGRQWRHPAPRPQPLPAGCPRAGRWAPWLHSRSRSPVGPRSSRPGTSDPPTAPSAAPAARPCVPPPTAPAARRGSAAGRSPGPAALPAAAAGSSPPPAGWWRRRRRSRRWRPGRSLEGARRPEGAVWGQRPRGAGLGRRRPSCGQTGPRTQCLLEKSLAAGRWSSLRGEVLHSLCSCYLSFFQSEQRCVQDTSSCDNSALNICFFLFLGGSSPTPLAAQRSPVAFLCWLPWLPGSEEAPSATQWKCDIQVCVYDTKRSLSRASIQVMSWNLNRSDIHCDSCKFKFSHGKWHGSHIVPVLVSVTIRSTFTHSCSFTRWCLGLPYMVLLVSQGLLPLTHIRKVMTRHQGLFGVQYLARGYLEV